MGKKSKKSRRRTSSQSSGGGVSGGASMSAEIQATIEGWAVEAAEAEGLELMDVECGGQGSWMVRISVERPGRPAPGEGVQVAECVRVSRYVEALMDADERIPERYTLEVSSPGVERRLRLPRHYAQSIDLPVRLVLRDPIEGRSTIEGRVVNTTERAVQIETEPGREPYEIEFEQIKRGHVVFDFSS